MIRDAIERLRYAPATFWRCVAVCGVALAVLYSLGAQARDPTGKYANSPYQKWFSEQHNSKGQWCCTDADGHPFYGRYTFEKDGSVTAWDGGKKYQIEKYKVLTSSNPTGSPVWWFVDLGESRTTFCFAPGTLS